MTRVTRGLYFQNPKGALGGGMREQGKAAVQQGQAFFLEGKQCQALLKCAGMHELAHGLCPKIRENGATRASRTEHMAPPAERRSVEQWVSGQGGVRCCLRSWGIFHPTVVTW